MKYKLIGENNYLDPIPTIFKNRGIDDYKSFISLKEDVTHDWRLLDHIEDGVELLDKHLKSNNNIYLQIDEDSDGYLANSIVYNYLRQLKPDVNLQWRTHDKKMHGIIPSTIPKEVDLLIIPDSSSGEFDKHKELKSRGIDILILDHHEATEYSPHATVINNQLSKQYPNKNFSAVGIVYKFCQALDDHYNVKFANQYLDLVAMGNVADSMSTKEKETRYYIQQGLKNSRINNPLIQAIIKKNAYNLSGKVNIKDISWTIAPTINATTRIGNIEDRENMFKAMTHQPITHSKLKDGEDPIDGMARILTNVRGRQNTMRTKGEKAVNERIAEKGIDNNKMIIIDASEIIGEPALNGVVAIKIAEKYKKPTLIIRGNEDGSVFGGSARAYDAGAIPNLKDFLNNTKMFEFCEGHQGAFGLEIKRNKLVPMNDLVNEKLKDVEVDVGSYDVDLELPVKHLTTGLIITISDYADHWGKDVDEPLLAIHSINLNKRELLLQGKNKNTIKFKANGIEFIKFRSSEEEYNEIMDTGKGKSVSIVLVGKASSNTFRGKTSPQIIIEDYSVEEAEDKLAF